MVSASLVRERGGTSALPRLVVFGEALTDFIRVALDQWRTAPGGACWNVARVAATLGASAAWAGAVSDDLFGQAIIDRSADAGLDPRFVQRVAKPPLLAIVHQSSPPAYFFIGNDAADLAFDQRQLPPGWTAGCEIAHFGGISLVREPLGSRLLELAEHLKRSGVRISFDPNHRPLMGAAYAETFERMLRITDYLKASEDDLAAIYPGRPLERAVAHLRSLAPAADLLVTRGADGMRLVCGAAVFEQASFAIDVADTVGAGDACLGGFLASLMQSPDASPDVHLRQAAATAAAACRVVGAHAPTADEVRAILDAVPALPAGTRASPAREAARHPRPAARSTA